METKINVNDMKLSEIKERIAYIENFRSILSTERYKLNTVQYVETETQKELTNIIAQYYPELKELKEAINIGDHIINLEKFKRWSSDNLPNMNEHSCVIALNDYSKTHYIYFLFGAIRDALDEEEEAVENYKEEIDTIESVDELKEHMKSLIDIKGAIRDGVINLSSFLSED